MYIRTHTCSHTCIWMNTRRFIKEGPVPVDNHGLEWQRSGEVRQGACTSMHTRTCIPTHTYIYPHMHTHTRTRAQNFIYTYIHTHTYIQQDSRTVYRSDFFAGLGWIMPRKLWEELGPKVCVNTSFFLHAYICILGCHPGVQSSMYVRIHMCVCVCVSNMYIFMCWDDWMHNTDTHI
jgi:hypothetical protein